MLTMFLGFVEFFATIGLAYIPPQFIPGWVTLMILEGQENNNKTIAGLSKYLRKPAFDEQM